MKSRAINFAALLFFLLATPLFGYVKTTYMVAMRDSIKLATDVFVSDTTRSWPVILIRTPYGKNTNPLYDFVIFSLINRGYAVVVQDTRGRFASQGVDSLFLDDGWGPRRDGYDTVEWIAQQRWSNGKVGTWGASALGITQYLMAGSVPPHLVCQFVEVAATNLYSQATYYGGAFLQNLAEGWITKQGSTYLIPFVVAHSNYDAIWERLDLETRFSVINVPIYHFGGWHDIFIEGTLNGFAGLQYGGAPGARGRQKLLIGPWTHGNWLQRKQGELFFPQNSTFNDFNEALRWFDYWLLGKENGIMAEPPVKYYVMGASENGAPGNEWRTTTDWPPATQPALFYLHKDGNLSIEKPAGNNVFCSYQYDPKNPVPTLGGRNLEMAAGPYDQRNTENRSDLLIFTSPSLVEPLEVAGKITVKLWVSSSAKDTDFMAKLTDVYPDGRSMLVCDGALQARHRYSLRQEHFLTPDSIYPCTIDLWSTAMVFNRGHRVRVAIASSNAPRFEPNPNTGKPFRSDAETVVATNTIYLDADHPSHLVLPVSLGGTVNVAGQTETAPKEFSLEQNYPNPTHGETQIAYSLSRTTAIQIAIYNLLGQEIRTLAEGLAPAGKFTMRWDGCDQNGQKVAAGIYLCRLVAGKSVRTRKLMVIR
ncbi:MAG: CocE/NonD family hydrolase [candidate division KSB1 bacterium]|nr:CocE/NonD family hydrolase [candidate division KSB1 bacterium]MDZ7303354.1 CocE/NonD family hydrolase [candidate division KSB1 bacterium]MDZ7312328.1 CocE/NonD family hydrolase [candidate division KSB1 bacterium]